MVSAAKNATTQMPRRNPWFNYLLDPTVAANILLTCRFAEFDYTLPSCFQVVFCFVVQVELIVYSAGSCACAILFLSAIPNVYSFLKHKVRLNN